MSTFKCPVLRISKFEPIKGKDRIHLAYFEGVDWQVIMAKAEHGVGDLVVYVPPDSVISQKTVEQYSLDYLGKGNRVKAIRLGGVYSFGLTLPVPERFQLGWDAAEYYGITKYEEPEPNNKTSGGKVQRRKNPNFQKYTDIENAKNYLGVFRPDELVIATEKIHGTNFRCGWVKKNDKTVWEKIKTAVKILFGDQLAEYEFIVGTHNTQLKEDSDNEYTYIVRKYGLKNKLKNYPNFIFFGEIYGKYEGRNIQDMTYGQNGTDVAFFDIFNVFRNKYVDWSDFEVICQGLNLPTVPVFYKGVFDEEIIKNLATQPSKISGQLNEGLVVKPKHEEDIRDARIGRRILKYINPAYLTRKDGTERH